MAITFDSSNIPRHERADAMHAAFMAQAWPQSLALDNPGGKESILEGFTFGRVSIFQSHLTGLRLTRNTTQIRTGPSDMLTIARQSIGVGRHDQFGSQHSVAPGGLMLVEMNQPYHFTWEGRGSSQALYLPIDEIGLPRTVVVGAAARLPASPLYDLVSTRIDELTAVGDALAESSTASSVGDITLDLARALIASAYDADYARGAMAEVLLPRIRNYIRLHLSEATLSPDSIARAHDISVRKLFRLCEDADFSLEQWIITHRLEGSREELARPETRAVSIAAIGKRWGFTNPSYFARRFRTEYGLTPREWRQFSEIEEGDAIRM